jgi:hypothetical protein
VIQAEKELTAHWMERAVTAEDALAHRSEAESKPPLHSAHQSADEAQAEHPHEHRWVERDASGALMCADCGVDADDLPDPQDDAEEAQPDTGESESGRDGVPAGWNPMDSAPKDGRRILATWMAGERRVQQEVYWYDFHGKWAHSGNVWVEPDGWLPAHQSADEAQPDTGEDEALARLFHDSYERLAPQFGYETRNDTREFDPASTNGKLMIAVCGEIRQALRARQRVPEEISALCRQWWQEGHAKAAEALQDAI